MIANPASTRSVLGGRLCLGPSERPDRLVRLTQFSNSATTLYSFLSLDTAPGPESLSRLKIPKSVLAMLLVGIVLIAGVPGIADSAPVGSPPGGARELQPGYVPQICTEADAPFNTSGATFGYYWSDDSTAWIQAPYCYARWGYLQASASQVVDAGATVTVTATPDDGRMAGLVAVQGGMSWTYPGTLVSGCGAKDVYCTVRVGDEHSPPTEWQWHQFHVGGPGRVFILPPSYAPRCQAEAPCLDTYTNAWSYVGVRPVAAEPTLEATLKATPAEIATGEKFTVTLRVTNPNSADIKDIEPAAPLELGGAGKVQMLAGPSPARVATLAPGAGTDFVWEFQANGEGLATFDASARAIAPSGQALTTVAHCSLGTAPLAFRLTALTNDQCYTKGVARVSIGSNGLDVAWEMPPRLDVTSTWPGDGVIPRDEVNPASWSVILILKDKGKELSDCPADKRYRWKVKLKKPRTGPKPKPVLITGHSCREPIQVDREGEYSVSVEELKASDGQPTGRSARNKTVIVQDWLIVGMGDSNGSGQGTALSGEPYEFTQCDRGQHSYQAKLAQAIESADKRTSVTFIHTACSGARTVHLTKSSYVGQEPNANNRLPPQIKQVAQRLKGVPIRREIDALILSIGINDAYFGGILGICITNRHDLEPQCPDQTIQIGKDHVGEPTLFETEADSAPTLDAFITKTITKKLPRLYRPVAQGLASLKVRPKRVYQTGYPEATTDETGSRCGFTQFLPLPGPEYGVFLPEWEWLHKTGELLEKQVMANHQHYHWNTIPVGPGFHKHGYCAKNGEAWFQSILGSALDQGNPYGTFHSLRPGQEAMADQVLPVLCNHLYGTEDCKSGKPRSPGTN